MIALISPFTNPYEQSSNRVIKLKKLLNNNHVVTEIITTDFDHSTRRNYTTSTTEEIIHLKVPSYKQNISIKRFWSHTIFAFKLLFLLIRSKQKYSALYCTVPTSLSALVCILYAKYRQIPCAVDVIDLWPNSFVVLTSHPLFFKILLFPWYLTSFLVYRYADKLFAASQKYSEYIQYFNPRSVSYVNLGIDLELIEQNIQTSTVVLDQNPHKITIAYGGSLGQSYDFDVILNALISLEKKGIKGYYCLFIGDGEQRDKIQNTIDQYNLSAKITGKLDYKDYIKYLSYCDIGINAFKENTEVVYSYKFNDYLGVGLAIINNLQGESSEIISTHQIGFNFDYQQTSLESVLEKLLTDSSLLLEMKTNSKLYAERFGNYELNYVKIIDYLKGNNG